MEDEPCGLSQRKLKTDKRSYLGQWFDEGGDERLPPGFRRTNLGKGRRTGNHGIILDLIYQAHNRRALGYNIRVSPVEKQVLSDNLGWSTISLYKNSQRATCVSRPSSFEEIYSTPRSWRRYCRLPRVMLVKGLLFPCNWPQGKRSVEKQASCFWNILEGERQI